MTSVEAADGAKCSPRLFAHPLLPVLPCSQGSERCSGNKRGLCCQGGAVGNQSEHGSQQTGVWAFSPLLCVPCKYTQSLKPGKPHWGKAGGWRVGGGAGRLNLYDNPMGDCGRGVRAREMGLLTLPCSQWSHLVLLTGDLRACNVGAFSGPWLSAEKEESEQMYSRA